ncbi:putative diguanylate cyclase YdaM [mine drainage metagenome]|uniref:Putative diguanylate cyclase YdaM n=1 Tax=mine drainage metagenome TaxID=410659 RepID=A0A1J5TFI1_9ZZZZ
MNSATGVERKSKLSLLNDFLFFHINERNFAVRIEQINSRIRLYPRIVISQLAIAFLLVGVMWNGVVHDVLFAWLALACAAHTFELVYWLRFHQDAQNIRQCRRWNIGFRWFSGIVGIIWGSTGLLMFVPGQMVYQAFLICVVLGISGAAVTSNPVHPPSLFIHLGTLISPILFRVLWVGDWTHLFLGSMLVIYILFVLNASLELIHTFEKSLQQRIDNEKLTAELKQAQSIAHIGSWHYAFGTGQFTWTEELYRIFGVSSKTFIPSTETLISLIYPDDQSAMHKWIEACATGQKPSALEFRCLCPDGTISHIQWHGELTLDAEAKPSYIVGTGQDVTERKRVEAQINNIAYHDALTGLPNRRLLDDRLEQAFAACKRSGQYGALIFLDLDNFKPLNDTHGHKVGDLLLVEVAHRLGSCVRKVDTVARFGGDEFVVILNELGDNESECAEQAGIVAEKIQYALAGTYWLPFESEGSTKLVVHQNVGASMGVALFNKNINAENVLKWADVAMYQAKNTGKNRILFHEALV